MKKLTIVIFVIVIFFSSGCIEKQKTNNPQSNDSIVHKINSNESLSSEDVYGEKSFVYNIHRNLPDCKFVLIGDSRSKYIINTKIYWGNDTTLKQQINGSSSIYTQRSEEYFFVEDYNYDGYKDIRFLRDWGSGGDFYSIWLFNPHTRQFINNDFYQYLANPVFNFKKKHLQLYDREGYGEETTRQYKFRNGKYILFKEDKNFIDEDSSNRYYVNEIRKRKNGKMHLISRSRIQEAKK
jgi:hypothetical protein